MGKKYYIPSLEEFHVGFEFEYRDEHYEGRELFQRAKIESDCVLRLIDDKSEDNYCEYDHFLSNIKYDIEHGDIRVKYLDKEDIENFGFKESHFSNINNAFYKKDFYTLNQNNCKIIISFNDNGNNIVLFNGIIKNKSELKRLLTQLQIIK